MENKNIELQAAETILENGVGVNIPAPFFCRVFGKKEIHPKLYQPYLGTLLHISKLSLKAGFNFKGIDTGDLDAAQEFMNKHIPVACKVVAAALLNSRVKIFLFSKILSWWLVDRLKPKRLVKIIITYNMLNGVQDFTTSIRLIRSLTMTTPTNLSPTDQGSQKVAPSA